MTAVFTKQVLLIHMRLLRQVSPFTVLIASATPIVLLLVGVMLFIFTIMPAHSDLIVAVGFDADEVDILMVDASKRLVVNHTDDVSVDETPLWSPDGRQIIFVSFRDDNREIYVVNADGSNLRQITTDDAHDINPSWSPDGTQIVFASNRDGLYELYIVDVPESQLDTEPPIQRLTFNTVSDSSPKWSSDGEQIVFLSNRGGQQLFAINADGSHERQLTFMPSPIYDPVWSSGGGRILYQSYADGYGEIFVMGVGNNGTAVLDYTPRNLTNNPTNDLLPVWSPDGRYIAFVTDRDIDHEIYIMESDGDNPINLTNNHADDTAPVWSPDGTQIAFLSNRDGERGLYIMDADGDNVRRIATLFSYLSWQP